MRRAQTHGGRGVPRHGAVEHVVTPQTARDLVPVVSVVVVLVVSMLIVGLLARANAAPPPSGLLPSRFGVEGYLPGGDFLRVLQERADLLEPYIPRPGRAEPSSRTAVSRGGDRDLQTWTILFYNDADFDPGYDPHADFCAEVCSSPNVSVVELQDTYGGPARLWYVDETHAPVLLQGWGEADMGDGETLRDLVAYGKEHYPADRYLLTLYDHGGGWLGACFDETNGGWLHMDEIAGALAETGGVDIIAFTAPCLMGAVESAYEMRGIADLYIGSEELSGYANWHGMMDEMCTLLETSGATPTTEIAAEIVALVGTNDYWPSDWLTMSAVETAALDPVIVHVDGLAQRLLDLLPSQHETLGFARDAAWNFGMGGQYRLDEIDLRDFSQRCSALFFDFTIQAEAAALRGALDAAVVAEVHGSASTGAHGLSIDFPTLPAYYLPEYTGTGLDFAESTHWDELLEAYLGLEPTPVLPGPLALGFELRGGPNPGDAAVVAFTLPAELSVRLDVFDLRGRRVRRLLHEPRAVGEHVLRWDGRDAGGRHQPSGVYLFVLEAGERRLSARGTLLR